MKQETVFVPLKNLRLSSKNVRSSQTEIEPLAQSLLTQGVLQNLIVVKAGKGAYEVVAGGRRLSALQQLLKRRKIGADYRVPCITVEDVEASAVSLTENTMREAMHPADEFEAFQRLADEGRSAEDIAALYGVTPMVVTRRLKLANVAPSLRERFRRGELTLEILMAFALSDDHAEQERIWDQLPAYQRTPEAVRAALTQQEVPANDRLAKFVGLKAYQKAGGAIRRDLFDDEGRAGYLTDRALLEQLATDKLARRAERAQAEEGAAWSEVRMQFDASDRSQFQRVPLTRGKPSAAQARRIAAVEKELASLRAIEDASDEQVERESTLEVELGEIEQMLERPHPEAAKLAGVIATVDWQGKAEVIRGLVRAADAKTLKKTLREASTEVEKRTEEQGRSDLSAALTETLTTHFTAALQARVAAAPGIALRIVTATLVEQVLSLRAGEAVARISAHTAPLSATVADIAESRAGKELQTRRDAWASRLAEVTLVWPWVLTLSETEVMELLAFCVAVSLDAISARGQVPGASELARAVGLDMRDYWQAGRAGFLARVPKAVIVEAVRAAKPDSDLLALEQAKKEDAIRLAEPILAEAHWLPELLRVQSA